MSTGARKIRRELNRQGHAVARCTVERLMRELGTAGAVRGKKVITTIPDQQAERAPDRVDRNFVGECLVINGGSDDQGDAKR